MKDVLVRIVQTLFALATLVAAWLALFALVDVGWSTRLPS